MSGMVSNSDALQAIICVVTVTYGDRKVLLQQLIDALRGQGVDRVIIVDNGAQWNVHAWAEGTGMSIDIVSLGTNRGSAAGFATGIERAMSAGAELIWLLDDDNRPAEGALQALLGVYHRLVDREPPSHFALLSLRLEHQMDIATGVPLERCYPRSGSFLGFHVSDVPYKVWRRTPWGQPRSIRHLPSLVPIPHAPYSGFFFNRKVVERIGLPNTEFVLYGDDTEFTARLPTSGGKIYLVPASSLEDMEASWNIKARFGNSFKGWLCGDSDLRAFYGARNRAYIDARQVGTCITYVVNRSVYLGVLRLLALKERRSERFRLLRSAIMDGEAGQLGPHPEHKLP